MYLVHLLLFYLPLVWFFVVVFAPHPPSPPPHSIDKIRVCKELIKVFKIIKVYVIVLKRLRAWSHPHSPLHNHHLHRSYFHCLAIIINDILVLLFLLLPLLKMPSIKRRLFFFSLPTLTLTPLTPSPLYFFLRNG